jgi:hypothetical protein
MARKNAIVTISADNRDHGKTFVITEMSATKTEAWATRAMLALTHAGVEVPDDLSGAGLNGLLIFGIQSLKGLQYDDLQALMDEMMECVALMPDANKPQIVRPLVENDIEEVTTRLRLKDEVLQLHVGFSIAGALSKHQSATMSRRAG